VATRDVFSADELAQLRGFPEIGRAELRRDHVCHRVNRLAQFPSRDDRLNRRPYLLERQSTAPNTTAFTGYILPGARRLR
jgi:hypothetical protein